MHKLLHVLKMKYIHLPLLTRKFTQAVKKGLFNLVEIDKWYNSSIGCPKTYVVQFMKVIYLNNNKKTSVTDFTKYQAF